MRRKRNLPLFLGFLPTLAIIVCILAINLTLAGCAMLDLTSPTPGVAPAGQEQPAPLTAKQKLTLVRERMGSIAYSIDMAHEQGVLGDELYGQIDLRWKGASTAFNAVIERPGGANLDPVDSALTGVQQALGAMLAGGGKFSALDVALGTFERALLAALAGQGG